MHVMLSLQLNCRVEELGVFFFFFPSTVAVSHYRFVSISKSRFKAG